MQQFAGKVALVTGGVSGIGRAAALMFAAQGAAVAVVTDSDEAGGRTTVAEIERHGGTASFILADVADAGAMDAMVQAIVARYGRLDCAINNAGIETALAPIAEADETAFDRCIAVNLKGVWLCLRAELRQMLLQGGGVIVNTSSVGGVTAVPNNAAYSAAKHGVIGLTKSAAVEYAKAGIRVNAVCPGLTRTGMTDRLMAASPDLIASLMPPQGRLAEPDEIAAMIVFLCSPAASFLTGQAVIIDGGATAV